VQDQQRAGFRVQPVECAPDHLGLGQLVGSARRRVRGRWGGARVVDVDLAHAHPALSAEQPAAGVHEDLRQPSVEPPSVAQAWQLAPGEDAGFLDRVSGVRVAACDGHRHAEQPIEPRTDQRVEGLGLAACGAFQQSLIGRPERET
jgi:hypothetical protein